MFRIIEKQGRPTIIQLTRGDSAEIPTEPYTNITEAVGPDDEETPIVLSDVDYILFTIGSPSGRIYLKKLLTSEDYSDEGTLAVKLCPDDTKYLHPYRYTYSFAYMPQEGTDVYTYQVGIFELLPSVSIVDDLQEMLHPESVPDDEDKDPDNEEETENEETEDKETGDDDKETDDSDSPGTEDGNDDEDDDNDEDDGYVEVDD